MNKAGPTVSHTAEQIQFKGFYGGSIGCLLSIDTASGTCPGMATFLFQSVFQLVYRDHTQ